MTDRLTGGRRDAMVFTALCAPLALLGGGKGLLWALPALAAAALLYCRTAAALPDGCGLADVLPKWLCAAELAFLTLMMARAAHLASRCWSGDGADPLFPLALLALAAAGTYFGAAAAGRSAVVLTWAAGICYAVLLATAAVQSPVPDGAGAPADVLPLLTAALAAMSALFLPAAGRGRGGRLWGALAAFTAAALYVSWGRGGEPFLTAVRGAEMLGTFQRYEALASCALTIGLYQLLALLGCAAAALLRRLCDAPVWTPQLGAAGLLFAAGAVPPWAYAALAAIFWGLVPIAARGIVKMKKL